MPYFIIACAQIFKFLEHSSPTLYKGAFSLAMANSGMNPVIYAWKNSNFRGAFSRLLKCKGPDSFDTTQEGLRSNLHRKSSSTQQHDILNGASYSTPPPLQKSNHLVDVTINKETIADTTITVSQINGSTKIILNNNNEIPSNFRRSYLCPDNGPGGIVGGNLRRSYNEITMNNIIINKCAIMENGSNYHKAGDRQYNSLTAIDLKKKVPSKQPVECVINKENGTIIYHINLVGDLNK